MWQYIEPTDSDGGQWVWNGVIPNGASEAWQHNVPRQTLFEAVEEAHRKLRDARQNLAVMGERITELTAENEMLKAAHNAASLPRD